MRKKHPRVASNLTVLLGKSLHVWSLKDNVGHVPRFRLPVTWGFSKWWAENLNMWIWTQTIIGTCKQVWTTCCNFTAAQRQKESCFVTLAFIAYFLGSFQVCESWWFASGLFNISLVGGLEHFLLFHILGRKIPTDSYFSEGLWKIWNQGLKPPTRLSKTLKVILSHENTWTWSRALQPMIARRDGSQIPAIPGIESSGTFGHLYFNMSKIWRYCLDITPLNIYRFFSHQNLHFKGDFPASHVWWHQKV